MHRWMDDGQVITIAHPEHSSDELKKKKYFLHMNVYWLNLI